ncbi:MAG: ABC transporter ATP-binding protein [Elusimicrobia bacterium]|nr:ABC transporter ATP-binding protein [Elusimicrobiota bacterium]
MRWLGGLSDHVRRVFVQDSAEEKEHEHPEQYHKPTPKPKNQLTPEAYAALPVVDCKGVTKIFRDPRTGQDMTALQDINFTIEDAPKVGELITMLGPSGCGKSTLLNIIAGLEPHFPPTRGEMIVKGEPVTGPGPDRGMVFQSYSSFPCYTILENVAFGLKLQGVPEKEREDIAAAWIKKVKLGGFEKAYPKELSGGMRQRVALARTLAVKPRIILMDEPFGALDRITRWEMQDLLIELWSEMEATVFLVTHDIPEAVFLGDRVFIFSPRPGRLVEIVKLPRPTEKAAQMQRTAKFADIVNEISRKVEAVDSCGIGSSAGTVRTNSHTDGSHA